MGEGEEHTLAVAESTPGNLSVMGHRSIAAIKEEAIFINQVMKEIMEEGEHYGVIEGTDKPTLFKPGAEKLNRSFHFRPDYEELEVVVSNELVYYRIRCTLTNYLNGVVIGTGIGSANSREEKWRYTNVATGDPVPKEYWAAREKGDTAKMKEIMGEDGAPKKKGKAWFIARRMENVNAYDKDNTICKMSQKRAMVAATLSACAASDIFTQDIEDWEVPPKDDKPKPPAAKKPDPEADPETGEVIERTLAGALVSQHQEANTLLKELGYKAESTKALLSNIGLPETMRVLSEHQMTTLLNELREIKKGLEGEDVVQPPLEPDGVEYGLEESE